MKRILTIIFVALFFSAAAWAQEKPFNDFERAVSRERGGFAGDKRKLSEVFNSERIRLGDSFESELWKYLGDDADKHFWIALFITAKSYLHGSSPLPELANAIREKALVLLNGKTDESSLGRKYTVLREMAIAAKLASRQADAVSYRSKAENILENYKDLGAYSSGLNDYERCIYANVQAEIADCKENGSPKETIVSAGVLNGRATSLPKPRYPEDVKQKGIGGQVVVKVVTDLNGNIITAEAISGPAELRPTSIEAARAAKVSPTKLSGQLVKVSGVFVYTFPNEGVQVPHDGPRLSTKRRPEEL